MQDDHTSVAPSRIARRGFVLGGITVVTGGVIASHWYNVAAFTGDADLTPPEALAQARSGAITLIDIRRPDEWSRSGIPLGAVPLDVRRTDFVQALLAQVQGDADRPIALICARGVRSARLAARLSNAGFSQVHDVPEGMLGSGAGPGWVARGLPVTRM